MAEDIRGLSVKFDADFSEFRKGMKEADKDINSTQRQLKSLQESLNLKFDEKRFARAQQQAQKALEATEQKANLLRQRLEQMEAAGVTDETRDEYNYLRETLEKTELQAQRLEQQLKQLDQIQMNHLTKQLDDVAKKADDAAKATRGISMVAGAMLTGLAAAGATAVSTADEIATLAAQYDTTAEAIQRFQYVALQSDVDAENLYKALVQVRAGLADLYSGQSSTQASALAQLGLDFDKLNGTEEQFYAIIDALASMEDKTQMVAIANDIFGTKLANNIIPLIKQGTDTINEYKSEFSELGALTNEQVAELAEFDNVMNKLKTQYKNVALQLGSGLLPVMQSFADILTNNVLPVVQSFVEWFSHLSKGTQQFIILALAMLALLSPMLKFFANTVKSISTLTQWFKKLDAATLSLYAKWLLLIAAVGTLFYVLANWSNMNPVQKIIALFGALSAVALAAAVAFGVFHSAWSIGLAVAGIVAGIATAIAAVNSAAKDINADVSFDAGSYSRTVTSGGNYEIPDYSGKYASSGSTSTTNSSYYEDNSSITINIEKNEYMSEDDIIRAVNRGLKQAKQARA